MPIMPMLLVFTGGLLIFCGITDRNPIDTVKQALINGTIPAAGSQKPKQLQPTNPPGYNPFGPNGTETPYSQQQPPQGPVV